jgi:hypothetical protein
MHGLLIHLVCSLTLGVLSGVACLAVLVRRGKRG